MDEKKQRDLRRHAAENFLNSLEQQLLEAFKEPVPEPPAPPPISRLEKLKKAQPQPSEPIDLSALEDAIADIDQYLQNKSPQSPDS
ncbi:MAG: hypothetical protein ACOVQ7_13835 [Limnoraphis robusta]